MSEREEVRDGGGRVIRTRSPPTRLHYLSLVGACLLASANPNSSHHAFHELIPSVTILHYFYLPSF